MRRKTLTSADQRRFLEAYAKTGVIAMAAQAANIARASHFKWMQDPDYQRRFADAEGQAIEMLEAELHRRITEGTEEPVVYQGEISYVRDKDGNLTDKPLTIKRKSDILLMFAMKAAKPDKYRENVKADVAHTGTVAVTHRIELKRLPDESLEQLEQMFRLAPPPEAREDSGE